MARETRGVSRLHSETERRLSSLGGVCTERLWVGSSLLKVYSTMLRERVFKGSSIPAASTRSVQRCSYKQWSEGQMECALKDVVTDGLSVRRAALMYNVPKSTLGDRVSGHVQAGAVSGPPRYLSCMEEGELARFIFHCGTIGYARSKSEILALVQRVLDCREIDRTVTHGWWESFQRRHPDLVLRSPAPLSLVRSKATDPEMLGRYFDLLEATLMENHLDGKPGQLFNMDESGMPLDPKAPKLVFQKGSNAFNVSSGTN